MEIRFDPELGCWVGTTADGREWVSADLEAWTAREAGVVINAAPGVFVHKRFDGTQWTTLQG